MREEKTDLKKYLQFIRDEPSSWIKDFSDCSDSSSIGQLTLEEALEKVNNKRKILIKTMLSFLLEIIGGFFLTFIFFYFLNSETKIVLAIVGVIIILSFFFDTVKYFAIKAVVLIIAFTICILLIEYLKIYGVFIIAAVILWNLIPYLKRKIKDYKINGYFDEIKRKKELIDEYKNDSEYIKLKSKIEKAAFIEVVYSKEKSKSYSLLFIDGNDRVYYNDYDKKLKVVWYDRECILDYDDILDVDVKFNEFVQNRTVTQDHTITTGSSRTSKALIGGMLFGGAGAAAGLLSGGKEEHSYTTSHIVSEEFINELEVVLLLENDKVFSYPFITSAVPKYGSLEGYYTSEVKYSYKFYTKVKAIINSKKNNQKKKSD